MIHQINIAVKSKVKAIMTRHTKKLINLCNKKSIYDNRGNHISFIKNTVYNMQSYTFSEEEYNALAFGLDHHIPTKTKRNVIETEFELYFQSIHRYTNEIPDSKISYLKTKLRNICHKYNHIHVPYKYCKIVETLSNNKNIMLLRQDKGRGIVVINRMKYTEKCLNLLNTDGLVKLNYDPTKTIEGKIQRSLQKIKNNLTKQEYAILYPTGSSPGKFYGTVKRHELKNDSTVDDLPLDQSFLMLAQPHINWQNTLQN